MPNSGRKPRILVLAPDLPYPVQAGGQMRMASLIGALTNLATVAIACIAREIPPETEAWVRRLGATIVHYPRPEVRGLQLMKERALMALSGSNLMLRGGEKRFFDQQLAECTPDLVWLETPYLLRYALPWKSQVAMVVDFWGTSEGARRDLQLARGLRKTWEWLRWRTAASGERKFVPRIDHIVAVSKLDADYFHALAPASRVWPVPNGIVKQMRPHEPHQPDGKKVDVAPPSAKRLLMTGDFSYRPNIDAATYFVNGIWPLIRANRPDVELHLVGRDPAPEVRSLASLPGVEVAGFVPDLQSVIEAATIYVLPMRLGSGIRSKLFDLFPLGLPIVSTTIGIEGLELRHEQHCLVADSPELFANSCLRLLEHEAERKRLGGNARKLAEEVYSQSNVERRLKAVIEAALHGRGEGAATDEIVTMR